MYPLIERFDDIQNDLPRLAWLTPNMPEPLLVWCIRSAIYDPMLNEVREIGITKATIEALHQLRHTWHEASYILEASCMLVADKTSRSYAAEIWIDRVSKGCIDSKRIGKILGSHQHTGWGPAEKTHRLDTATNDECQSPAQPGIGESNRSNAGRTSGEADQRFKEVVGDLCGTVINQPQQSQRRTGFTPVECLERGR